LQSFEGRPEELEKTEQKAKDQEGFWYQSLQSFEGRPEDLEQTEQRLSIKEAFGTNRCNVLKGGQRTLKKQNKGQGSRRLLVPIVAKF